MKEDDNWDSDQRHDAAILINPSATRHGTGAGYVWTECGTFVLYCCYISPNVDLSEFNRFIDGLGESVRDQGGETIIVGDFNAWSTVWGSRTTNHRGNVILDWIASDNLTLLNDGSPNFRRGNVQCCIDLTICSPGIATLISEWCVLPDAESLTFSDHLHIMFKVDSQYRPSELDNGIPGPVLADIVRGTVSLYSGTSEIECIVVSVSRI